MSFKNPHDTKEYQQWYYQTHRKQWRRTKEARTILEKSALKYRQKLKEEVIKKYGGRCTCCGESELIFLAIDHIDGKGAEHRKKIIGGPQRGGIHTYLWLRKNKYPKGFQVHCFNCNWAKSRGGCPHKKRDDLLL